LFGTNKELHVNIMVVLCYTDGDHNEDNVYAAAILAITARVHRVHMTNV